MPPRSEPPAGTGRDRAPPRLKHGSPAEPKPRAANEGEGPPLVRLRSRTVWTLLGQATYIVSQFFVLLLLTRLAGVEEVGRFGYATALITPIYWLTDLGLRTNKTTDTSSLHSFSDLLALRLLTTALGYGLILAIAALLAADAATLAVTVVFAAAKGVETLSDVAYGVFQRHGRMAQLTRSMVMRSLGSLGAFAILLVLTGSVPTAFAGHLLIWTGVYVVHDLPEARRLSAAEERRVRWARLWPTVIASLPLGGAQFLSALNTALPRLFIERFAGLEALGIFTALAYFLQAANTTATAVSRSIAGHLADLFQAGRPAAVRRTIVRYVAVIVAIGVGGLLIAWPAGNAVLGFVFGPDLQGQTTVLMLILATAVLRSAGIVLQTAPIARRRFMTMVRLRALDAALVAAASFAGGVLAGIEGVAAGLVAAAAVQFALLVLIFERVTGEAPTDASTDP